MTPIDGVPRKCRGSNGWLGIPGEGPPPPGRPRTETGWPQNWSLDVCGQVLTGFNKFLQGFDRYSLFFIYKEYVFHISFKFYILSM